jgi:hypothetical protein
MIDKGLYQAPQGLEALTAEEPDVEIEIINPDGVTINADGVEIEIVPDEEGPEDFNANLADFIDPGELDLISEELDAQVETDVNSRKDWVETYVKGLDVLGIRYEERTEPWNGACGVFSTILSEAAIRFQAETIMETFPAQGPVRTKIIGKNTRQKEEAAIRVQDDMNYELTEKMPEYRPEHERLLYSLGLSGSAFKKVYYDPALGRQVSLYIPAEDVIVSYGASNLETCERITHLMRKTKNDLRKLQVAGFYRDVELGDPVNIISDVEKKKAEDQGWSITDDDRYQIAESHISLDIPGFEDKDKDGEPTGIALPYVVTYERGTNTILAIRRNWDPEDDRKLKRQHFVHYTYVPGFGFYGMGLIHLIGGYARAGTALIRQLVDAGTLSNLPGGLKSRGLRVKGDDTPIAPGEFRDVDVPSGAIKDNIMTLPYKEPSQVLAVLLDKINEEGRRLGAISDMNISDMSANAPVGTTLALLERTLKTMSAVQARVHYAMKQEFKLLKEIIADYTPEEYEYEPEDANQKAKRSDYNVVEVLPVSDPNASTMAQRVVQYQAVIQLAQSAPQIYDLPQLHRQMLDVLNIKDADKLVPLPDDMKPVDPVSENMNIVKGKPAKAFIGQDHDAHIAVHSTFLQDPMVAATLGQNPMAQQMQAAMMAHIAEHLGFRYRKQIEERLGVPLPPPDKPLPEDTEVQLSRLVAQASGQLLQMHKAEAAQAQAQQQAQDPLIQMQQQELQIKAADQKRKEDKDAADVQLAQEKLRLEKQRIIVDAEKEQNRLMAQQENQAGKVNADLMKTILGKTTK